MNKVHLKNQLSKISMSMFRKDFFDMYYGSISAKTETNRFLINKKEAIFDNIDESQLIELHFQEDYRWTQASIDSKIHKYIYNNISEAKYITFTMPPFTTAYSINHTIIIPTDYRGKKELGSIEIYTPKEFEEWNITAPDEIVNYFKNNDTNILVIKGYGIYSFNRDIFDMIKKISILEKSVKLLMLEN